jgi:hypothetical protein
MKGTVEDIKRLWPGYFRPTEWHRAGTAGVMRRPIRTMKDEPTLQEPHPELFTVGIVEFRKVPLRDKEKGEYGYFVWGKIEGTDIQCEVYRCEF